MTYSWKCQTDACEHITHVERRLAEIDTPPDSCEACGTKSFKQRVILPPESKRIKGFILMDGGAGGFHQYEYTKTRSIR